ncbi:MAG: hypothetical protein ICV83_08545, partial [Cytophagales bacterium]|nr:hypothetical protein [Cytophagales bacterium]
SRIHLRDLTIELVRYLLINRAVIVYGGNLAKEGYTGAFADLAYQYRARADARKIHFENYFPYPIYCQLDEDTELEFQKKRTGIVKVPPPAFLGADPDQYLPPDTEKARVVWAVSLTEMRQRMIAHTHARILVGGKASDYKGRMPGTIEEAKIALEQGKPLYLIGALGGGAREVIDALEGRGFRYPTNAFHQSAGYQAFRQEYQQQTGTGIDPAVDAAYFAGYGVDQLAARNGLTADENRRLFATTHLSEMLYYLFKGLKNALART